MISKAAQRKICQRSRRPIKYPPAPTQGNFHLIPEQFRKTLDGADFLLSTVEVNAGVICIFTTHENIRRLATATIWMLDGTFSTAPEGFKQIYTILGSIGSGAAMRYLPLVYTLLPNKSEDTYTRALEELTKIAEKNHVDLDPEVAMTDFERAAINAIGAVFPDCRRQGCFFHLTQNFFKRVQSSGLSGGYVKGNGTYMIFKKIEALAFVPVQKVEEAFKMIVEAAPPAIAGFIEYIEDNYVLGKIRKRKSDGTLVRSPPAFPPELWNVHQCVLKRQPRTTNRIEGWHNRWSNVSQEVGFYPIVESLQKEQKITEGEILNILQGIPAPKRSLKETEKDERLLALAVNFETTNLMDYIIGVSLILKD